MKKVVLMVLAMMTAALMLTACGSGETGESGKKVYKVGVTQYADHPSLDNCRKGFIEGLKENGFTEGDNLEIEYKAAQANDSMNTQIAQTFANSGMDLVCGIATPSAQALYVACREKKIPVVFNAISDPIGAGLAVSETEPMEGISGISDLLPVEDQLKLIRAVLPDVKKIGILYTTSEANSVSTIEIYKNLAPKYGFEIVDRGISKQAEVTQAADVLLNEVDCISNLTDNTVVAALSAVLEKANAKKIPVFGSEEEQVKNGCIASAGLDYVALGVQAGNMAAKVLKGEDISKMPFETIKESKLTVNESVASELGIEIPEEVSGKADIVK
ncbi:MAG: ABC transporter substrate-binding protein [Clostridia bacterium]|nr:ABC transporter substrate-binding protein [Clostridia bacterium]